MKNIGIIIIILIAFTSSLEAQLLATLSTKAQGGVMGTVNTIVPQIGFYEADTDLMAQTMIFNNVIVTENTASHIFSIDAKNGGINFQNFCSVLTSDKYATLKVGHKISKVKTHVGRSVEDWFNSIDLKNEEIGSIELIITKINFNIPGANRTNDGKWTDFEYEITLNIYGTNRTVAQK